MNDFYALADLKIDELNRLLLKRIEYTKKQIRKKKYDAASVVEILTLLYKNLDSDTRKKLLELTDEQYRKAAKSIHLEELDDEFEDLFLENILESPDPITRYSYDAEIYRKRDRAIEGINSVSNIIQKQEELNKAMRFWAQMTNQYADIVAYDASVKAYEDAGIKYVVWHTQEDDKVCKTCKERDKRIYPVAALPSRPHWRCRCWFE